MHREDRKYCWLRNAGDGWSKLYNISELKLPDWSLFIGLSTASFVDGAYSEDSHRLCSLTPSAAVESFITKYYASHDGCIVDRRTSPADKGRVQYPTALPFVSWYIRYSRCRIQTSLTASTLNYQKLFADFRGIVPCILLLSGRLLFACCTDLC